MQRPPRISAETLAGDDEADLVSYSDFGPASGKTLAEQRVSGAAGMGQPQPPKANGFGLGSLASATASATFATGRLLGQAAGGLVAATSSVGSGGGSPGGGGGGGGGGGSSGYPSGQPQTASGGSSSSSTGGSGFGGLAGSFARMGSGLGSSLGLGGGSGGSPGSGGGGGGSPEGKASPSARSGAGGLAGGAALLAGATFGGAAAMAGGLTSALGWGPGTGLGDPSAEIAVGLANGLLEIMAAAPNCIDAENPQVEVVGHVDAVVACRSLNDLGARLLDYWYAVKADVFSPWPLHMQQNWVKLAYLVKYGDLRRGGSGALARCACGLLLELGEGFRASATVLDTTRGSTWAAELLRLAELCDRSPPPPGWCFPGLGIAQKAESAFDQPRFSMVRADARGITWAKGKTVIATAKTGFLAGAGASAARGDEGEELDEGSGQVAASPGADFRALTGGFDDLAARVGGGSLSAKCLEKSDRLFNQKTRPIHFLNQASVPLKICLFSESDRLCAVPLGGVGGSCVVTLDPNLRAQLRPPGTAHVFQLKVLQPGLIERQLYMALVQRGSSVQLRSCECSCD